jgi:hypothetical protein
VAFGKAIMKETDEMIVNSWVVKEGYGRHIE